MDKRSRSSRPRSNYAASLRIKHNSAKSLDVYRASSIVTKMRSRSKTRKKTPIPKVTVDSPPPPEPELKPEPQPEPEPDPDPEPESGPEPEQEQEKKPEPEPEAEPDQLEQFITCHVCKAPFVNPKTLPCLHTFCKYCLLDAWPGCEEAQRISCPLCKEMHVKNAEELEPTPFVKRMIHVQIEENTRKNSNKYVDDSIEFVKAVNNMEKRCQNVYDETCVDNRSEGSLQSKDTASTQPIKCDECLGSCDEDMCYEETGQNRSPGICCKHPEGLLEYFCSKCDCFICIECLITEHPHFRHGVSKVNDAAPKYKEFLGMLKKEAEYTQPELLQAAEIFKSKTLRVEAKLDKFKEKIRKRKETILLEVKDLLEKQEKYLVEEVTRAVGMEKDDYLKQAKRLDDDIKVLKTYCNYTDNLVKYGNSFDVMETKTALIKRMHRLCIKGKDPFSQSGYQKGEQKTAISYECDNSAVVRQENALGYIRTSEAYGPTSTASGPGLINVMCGHAGMFGITTRDRNGEDIESGGAGIELKITSSTRETIDWSLEDHHDGTYTISYTTNILGPHIISVRIAGIPIQGNPFIVNAIISENYCLRDEPLMILNGAKSGLSNPTAVAVDSSSQIYVVDRGNRRIMTYSDKGEHILTIGQNAGDPDILQSPKSVAISKSNKIIVSDTKSHQIQVFNKQGKFLYKFGQLGPGEGELKEPDGVTVDSKDNIIVADTMNHRIQVFRENGEYVSSFGKQGTKEGELLYPAGITVDKAGNILVCDCGQWNEKSKESNNRIQVFNSEGKYQYEFGSNGQDAGQFKKPARIATDKKGRILVTDMDNNRIQVFKANGIFLNTIVRRGKSECFDQPCGIAIMQDGRIVTSERQSNQLQIF